MSTHFYYVVSFNVQNRVVKRLLDNLGMYDISDDFIDLKVRSKIFNTFSETCEHAVKDFDRKMDVLYLEDEEVHTIKIINAINPIYGEVSASITQSYAQALMSATKTGDWDANCVGTFFYTEADEESAEALKPESWMFKYEAFIAEDVMEVCHNGESTYSAHEMQSSTYH